jgi:hypothetical protein
MKEHGIATWVDPGSDKPLLEVGTIQCCHCGGHWFPIPGSKIKRGFCMPCGGFFCGPGCERCVPTEQLLENMEKGLPEDFRPICVPVSFTGE